MILKKQGMIFISFPVNQNRWSENAPKRVKFQKFRGGGNFFWLARIYTPARNPYLSILIKTYISGVFGPAAVQAGTN